MGKKTQAGLTVICFFGVFGGGEGGGLAEKEIAFYEKGWRIDVDTNLFFTWNVNEPSSAPNDSILMMMIWNAPGL